MVKKVMLAERNMLWEVLATGVIPIKLWRKIVYWKRSCQCKLKTALHSNLSFHLHFSFTIYALFGIFLMLYVRLVIPVSMGVKHKRRTVCAKVVYSIFIKFLHIVFIIIYCLPLVLTNHACFFPIPPKKLPLINTYLVMALSFFSLINSFVLNSEQVLISFNHPENERIYHFRNKKRLVH